LAPAKGSAPNVLGRLREWLFRVRAIERARTLDAPWRREHVRRARAAADLGDEARERHRSEGGAYLGAACELYREAVHFTLLALAQQKPDETSGGPWQAAPRELLMKSAGGEEELLELERLLGTPSFVEFATLTAREQELATEKLARFALELAKTPMLSEPDVAELSRQRVLRSLGALLVVLVVVVIVLNQSERWRTARADLARGRSWRASSEFVHCNRSTKSCGEFRELEIFFHTLEESSPWLEIDLGAPRDFSRVMVRNRTDCCRERALPLVIEVSNDQKHWTEVMRRTTVFSSWTAKFSRQRARFVRLRVAATSILHLEGVKVLP